MGLFGDDSASWATDHGRPARAVGIEGMPSYESGNIAVYELLLVRILDSGNMLFFPRDYAGLSYSDVDGFVNPHPPVRSRLSWRPYLYEKVPGGIERRSSQQELEWRYTWGQTMRLMELCKDDELPPGIERIFTQRVTAANTRAEALMLEFLSPQQRIEYCATRCFRVRGAATGDVYGIALSNGFCLLDKQTGRIVRNYCLHPEYWLPHADVALATKLALEDPELEITCLENAGNGELVGVPKAPTEAQRVAARYEEELIR